jgi:hypothetical protein
MKEYEMAERRQKIRQSIDFLETQGFKVIRTTGLKNVAISFERKKQWHIDQIKTGCTCDHCSKTRLDRINHWGDIEETWWREVLKGTDI